jgi:hypothetical protein
MYALILVNSLAELVGIIGDRQSPMREHLPLKETARNNCGTSKCNRDKVEDREGTLV